MSFFFLYSGFCFFFPPKAFDALMSNCTPNLNYMRKGVLGMRGPFVNVMLIFHMKSKATAAGLHTHTKGSLNRNLHRSVSTLEMHRAALSHL